ncbi:MAG: FRG domain-containing protein [Propylenella sp.]
MPRLKEYRPKNVSQYLEHIEQIQRRAQSAIWFRGAGLAVHRLIPSIYRHPKAASTADLQTLERQIMARFRQRSIPYHSRDLRDDWEALFFMQHYGVPTRLLDWTENPLTAVYFALMYAPVEKAKSGDSWFSRRPAAVWVLDPAEWNEAALRHVSYTGGPLTPGDDALRGFAPHSTITVMNAYPVALYGAHNSARIVAQQGVFTIFGTNRMPMETLVRNGTFPPSALTRIVISPRRVVPMRTSLLGQGVTESTVFPDLEGLAKETKRYFGFEA